MFFPKTPPVVQRLLPGMTWRLPSKGKNTLYLTFDDGPIPEVTPWILDTLAQYGAKATFFCVGDNVRKHPAVYAEVLAQGHSVGNHTFNHVNGWKTDTYTYFDNIQKCAEWVKSPLFRPPYGLLRPAQFRQIRSQYQVVMWDVLSGDYAPQHTPQQCAQHVLRLAQPGSIVLFHDSLKAERNVRYALPQVLDTFSAKGWQFESIPLEKR